MGYILAHRDMVLNFAFDAGADDGLLDTNKKLTTGAYQEPNVGESGTPGKLAPGTDLGMKGVRDWRRKWECDVEGEGTESWSWVGLSVQTR